MKRISLIGLTAGAIAGLAIPATSSAGGGDSDGVERPGQCTGASRVEIKVKSDDGRLELEFEVDQNRNGVPWRVKVKDSGEVVVRHTARTRAPSGSFSIERRIANLPGTDHITGIARNTQGGERCAASVSI